MLCPHCHNRMTMREGFDLDSYVAICPNCNTREYYNHDTVVDNIHVRHILPAYAVEEKKEMEKKTKTKRLTHYQKDGTVAEPYNRTQAHEFAKRLAQYEDMFERWGIDDLDTDELEAWHERMIWHVKKCDETYRKLQETQVLTKRGLLVRMPDDMPLSVMASIIDRCESINAERDLTGRAPVITWQLYNALLQITEERRHEQTQ